MIDTMLFLADLPAGTYNIGDTVTLNLHTGPSVVRDGLGTPVLKSIHTGILTSGTSTGKGPARYKIKNSNWNDPIYNGPSSLNDVVAMSEKVTGCQTGNDCVLQVNSSFEVEATFFQASTTTAGNVMFCTIDIEYSNNSGLKNPQQETGTPCSIVYEFDSVVVDSTGNGLATANWVDVSFDNFKAGYRYLMQKVSLQVSDETLYGFVKFSGGASMGGLARIIPISSLSSALAKEITYTSPEVKGPLTVGLLVGSTTAATYDIGVTCDYVKRM